MSRSLRWIAVTAACATLVAGAALAVACDSAKKTASTTKVSASSCASKTETASVKTASSSGCAAKATTATASAGCARTCTAAEMAACKASMAKLASSGDCKVLCAGGKADLAKVAPFSFVSEQKDVEVAVQRTDNGFAMVFVSAHPEAALKAAEAGKASLSKSAACSYTRADMVKAAGGCQKTEATVTALADCNVTVDSNETEARTVVSSTEDAKVKELHAWLDKMGYAPSTPQAAPAGE